MSKIEAQVELAPLTTLGVGGAARHYARVETEADLRAALEWARVRGVEVRVLGGGSNIVVADAGFPGLVIDLALRGISMHESETSVEVRAAAGEPWDDFVAAMIEQDMQGLECLSGIPGRVGATPIQNVGAYGQDVSETVVRVRALDRVSGNEQLFTTSECRFSYRDSWFKSQEPGRFIVTEVSFRLQRGGPPAIRYAELERNLAERGVGTPTLSLVRDTVLELRRSKSMLLDTRDPNARSCGSFFMNPVLDQARFATFAARAQGEGNVPQFPQADGSVKLSAGWLIEHAGFPRGTREGAVGLSTKHALALVAHAGATAAEVASFAERVRQGVHARFEVLLEPEPVFWGF